MLIPVIEELLNRAIGQDETAPAKVEALSGNVIQFSLSGPELHIYLCFIGEHISIQTDQIHANASVTGSPLALAKMFLSRDPAKSLFDKEVKIDGNRNLVSGFNDLMSSLDIDWEEELARHTTDQFSHMTSHWLHEITSWYKNTSDSLHADIEEYLQEEIRSVPRRDEVSHFISGVNQLRDGIERIEARIQRVKDKRS